MPAINLSLDHQTAITALFYGIIAANVFFFIWLTKAQTNAKRRRERLFNVSARARGR
jgi:hypothetical protein